MVASFLDGITRQGKCEARNPGDHMPLPFRNRVIMERHSPDGSKARVVRDGNIMTTLGLDNLVNYLSTSALAFTATNGWIRVMAVGTDSTAAASTQTALVASTASVHISAASMAVSDAGARTLQYNATFDDSNAYTIKEVGLFGTDTAAGTMVARTALAATDQVVKGTGDTVNVSYQIIFTTA